MILPAQTIRALAVPGPMGQFKPLIDPFCEQTVLNGMTFGLSPAGYDIRLAEEIPELRDGNMCLASSIERFCMPNDLLARVCDKSSWARKGVFVQNTVIEPGWEGYLTLEISFHGNKNIRIAKGSAIAQIIFERLEAPTEQPYQGKYQNQPAGPQPSRDQAS